ncbi:peptidase S24/S26A/S26B/S26C [Crepidotus variabilis]|uniref:Mitochondrial inner membrane protease subunit n=1 Tax=Crepidotus variabilis TaxID=179855 RepID=A0A9P6ESX3_9AGAR|nr:peptidase S24/S26A/S26B/S26C [Crepidotus variabilis]
MSSTFSYFSGAFKKSWAVLYWLPTGYFFGTQFYHVKAISGRSMQPTLNPDSSTPRDVALFSRFAVHTLQDYGRDDIVTFRSPENPSRILIKRIIGVEGDTVKTLPPYPDKEVDVPQGHVWVEGDEHFVSDDSNRFGPIPAGLIESKLTMLIWPLNRFGRLKPQVEVDTKPWDRDTINEQRRQETRHARVTTKTS